MRSANRRDAAEPAGRGPNATCIRISSSAWLPLKRFGRLA
jgi:hypothetical protein